MILLIPKFGTTTKVEIIMPAKSKASAARPARPSRRSAPRKLDARMVAPSADSASCKAAKGSHPDAELLRLGAEFDRLLLTIPPLIEAARRIEKAAEAARRLAGLELHSYEDKMKFRFETGIEGAIRDENRGLEDCDGLSEKILSRHARTFAGLAVKLRALRYILFQTDDQTNIPADEQDWDRLQINLLVAEVERLAAAEGACAV